MTEVNMNQPKIEDIIRSFTDDQKKLYDTMMGDEKKLFADWSGCRKMHADAMVVLNDKDIGPQVRLFLMAISKYWSGRKQLMEDMVTSLGRGDLVSKWYEDGKQETKQ
jgi:hypothetical protein